MMKMKWILGLLFLASTSFGDVKISQLPLGVAASVGVSDSFPYVDASANVTKRLKISDIINTVYFANIPRSQIAAGTAYRVLVNDSSGRMSENAALTPGRVVYPDSNGQLTGSSTFYRDPSTTYLGVGDAAPESKLHVTTASLGTTGGDQQQGFRVETNSGNEDRLITYAERSSAGSDWNTADWYFRRRIDSTYSAGFKWPGGSTRQVNLYTTSSSGPIFGLEANSAAGTAQQIRFLNTPSSGRYNFAIGNQIVNSNNFEIIPSTATDGTTFSSPAVSINNSGNIGAGLAPSSSWSSSYRAFSIARSGNSLFARTGDDEVQLAANAIADSTSTYVYGATDTASVYKQVGGVHIWSTAASGTAGNAITFEEIMRLSTASSQWGLRIGTTTQNSSGQKERLTVYALSSNTASNSSINALTETSTESDANSIYGIFTRARRTVTTKVDGEFSGYLTGIRSQILLNPSLGADINRGATSVNAAFVASDPTNEGAGTVSELYRYAGFLVEDSTFNSGASKAGVFIGDQSGATLNYGLRSRVSAGSGKYNLYAEGTADNFLAGNTGIGTAPSSSWSSSYNALNAGRVGNALFGRTGDDEVQLAANAVADSTSTYVYGNTDTASVYKQAGGVHSWSGAASGTAGNAITFTQIMQADVGTTGGPRVRIGTTSAQLGTMERLTVYGLPATFNVANYGVVSHVDVNNNGAVSGTQTGIFGKASRTISTSQTDTGGVMSGLSAGLDFTVSTGTLTRNSSTFTAGLYIAAPTWDNAGGALALSNYAGIYVRDSSLNTGTIKSGILINAQSGATNNYGLRSLTSAAATSWNLYLDGTAQNYLAGNLGIGVDVPLTQLHVKFADAAATTSARLDNADTTMTTNQEVGAYEVYGNDPTGAGAGIKGSMRVKSADSTGTAYYTSFGVASGSANDTEVLRLNSDSAVIASNMQFIVTTSASPASGAACTAGRIVWDTSFLYVCTASGAWKRTALTGGY